jgi:hypothetical protein
VNALPFDVGQAAAHQTLDRVDDVLRVLEEPTLRLRADNRALRRE